MYVENSLQLLRRLSDTVGWSGRVFAFEILFCQEVKCCAKRCVAHGWTCVYEKKNRGRRSAHGTKRSQGQKAALAMDSETPDPAVLLEVSGAPRARSLLSKSPSFSTAESGERIFCEGNTPSVSYTSLQDREKEQDGKAFSSSGG
jgi:hypothetical protein